MNMPVPRRRRLEPWRGGWPGESWDPTGEFERLWERMGRLFGSAVETGSDAWVPTVETEETDDAYMIRAELPGMKRDDINIELRGNELRIDGEVKAEEKGEGKPLRQRHGRFAYRATLPADADAEKADASLSDGVLTVRLPKAAQGGSRKIAISS